MSLSLIILAAAEPWYPLVKNAVVKAKKKRNELNIARTILQFIQQDIEFSAYQGCRTMDSHYPVRCNFATNFGPFRYFKWNRNFFGFNPESTACLLNLPKSTCARALKNQDILVIYNIPLQFTGLKSAMTTPLESLDIIEKSKIRTGGVILISDCMQGDLFIASEVVNENNDNRLYHQKSLSTNLSNSLSKGYGLDASVVELQTVAYYLGLSPRQAQQAPDQQRFSLYRDDLFHEAVELIEGIVAFEVEYFLNSTLDEGIYLRADVISEELWPYVSGLRIKVTSDQNQQWEYEFAVRNRHGVNLNPRVVDVAFPFISTFDEVGYRCNQT